MKKAMLTLSFIATAYILNGQVLYSTTREGGKNNGGTICQFVTTTNTLTAAFSFDALDGGIPEYTKLLQASDGKLYGMTSYGGSKSYGVIFSYDASTSIYTKLIDFDDANGALPYGSLIQASDGKLYGMTSYGGSGAGVIFSYDPATSNYIKLKDFDGANGANPYGSLIQASDGKLYGMTSNGGSSYQGVIFSYDPVTSTYTKLKDFDGNGARPYGSLIQASDGKLYGMTYEGGSINAGVIFSYDPATSTYTKLIDFDGEGKGGYPYGSLLQASDGKLYGTGSGGLKGYGIIFSYDPATLVFTRLKDFDYINGTVSRGSLIQASNGKLYGTGGGGSVGYGVIFSYDPSTSIYTKLIDFDGEGKGGNPHGSLIQAFDGKLYGMTSFGGSLGVGIIFSYAPASSIYTKLKDFDYPNGGFPGASPILASDGKLYGMTSYGGSGAGVIFSYDPAISAYTKLKDFDGANGANPYGSLIQASDGKLYGLTYSGGDNDYGVIFSYDAATSAYTKLFDFDSTNGAFPMGNLIQANDGKLYGMTYSGGDNDYGVIFSYHPATSAYTKLYNFNSTNGAYPNASLIQASDGKLYGMTSSGGNNDYGVIFSYDPATSTYTRLQDFNGTNGRYPTGSLMQASDGKLYGLTLWGGDRSNYGVIFSFNPVASVYTKLYDFDYTNGSRPYGSLMQASDGKLYGMTSSGGSNDYGVAFSYDPASSAYTKLSDFNGDNGRNPGYTSFVEVLDSSGIQISIADKSVMEGNQNKKFIAIPVTLNEKSEKILRIRYSIQDSTATVGDDYIAQSGTLIFPAGIKRIVLPVRIKGDETPEANETFRVILSDPVNATIADSTSIVTILDDDALSVNESQKNINTKRSITLSPNPAQDKVTVMLKGYGGNVVLQLSTAEGRILQQQKLQSLSAKAMQHQMNVDNYSNGTYMVTVIDGRDNRQTKKLVIDR